MIGQLVDDRFDLVAATDGVDMQTVDRQLASEREVLGERAKNGRKLRLARAGEHLLALARRILPQLEYAEEVLGQVAAGQRGTLRIGMECHPCYQWLLRIVAPYLQQWPDVDVDVKQKFQFGGIGALFGHEIDLLVIPDPFLRKGLELMPVFDYEQVPVVGADHRIATRRFVEPGDLASEILICYPVERERLDIYNRFLWPANQNPKHHKVVETTDIMLQMVVAGRDAVAGQRVRRQDTGVVGSSGPEGYGKADFSGNSTRGYNH